jgi:serine/threonine protein kinase
MSAQPSLDAGTEVSRYRVEELVARGGMGLVYRARDVRLDRQVALKVLSPELSNDERFRERFVRESRLTAAVDHPHVIPVYEADEWNGLLYLAMRFVRGVDLHTVLARTGRMDPDTAVPLLSQAGDALDAAHEIHLVHRDVKPGNFMLAGAQADRVPSGTHVYLTDFGLTKRATSVSGLTRTGQFLGSLHYVAPEQIRGEDVDARTDVYALACVAFEMFTGLPPFRQDQDAALLWAHMSIQPPRVTDDRPDLPDELDDVLAAGLAKDAAQRPDSAGEFVRAVRAALGGRPSLSLPERAASPSLPTAPLPRDGRAVPSSGAPATQVAAANAGQQRQVTYVGPGSVPPGSAPPPSAGSFPGAGADPGPGAPAGGYGGPPPPPWGAPGGQSWPPAAEPPRSRRRWLIPMVLALVAVLAAALVIWSPWSGPTLARQDLVVIPFAADLPDDWEVSPVTGDLAYSVAGTRDWSGLSTDDADVMAQAETALTEDPESLVHLYVDGSDNVYTSDSKGLADQLQSGFEDSRFVAQGTRQVDGREAYTASGIVEFGDGQVRIYAVTLQDEPRVLLLFVAPSALYDEWKPTFDAIADSVTFTG